MLGEDRPDIPVAHAMPRRQRSKGQSGFEVLDQCQVAPVGL
jgi:hypothetical protein